MLRELARRSFVPSCHSKGRRSTVESVEPVNQEMTPSTPLPPFSSALFILRTLRRWSQIELGRAASTPANILSDYEKGRRTLTRKRLDALAETLGYPPEAVDEVLSFLRGFLPADPGAARVGLSPADVRNIDRAAITVGQAAAEAARLDLTRALLAARAAEARSEAEEAWARLKGFPPRDRRLLVDHVPEFQTWALCERLCAESVRAAAADARQAVELAELALRIAARIPGEESWRARVQGYAWAHVGNARRVASQLPAANEAFDRAWSLWRVGAEADPGWLEEGRLLDLEASLRRDQRRLPDALELLDRALAVASTEVRAGRILLNRAFTLEQMGDHLLALDSLERAIPLGDWQREPRQLFGLQFNRAVNLCHLGRHCEAAELLPQVREIAIELRNGLDLIRVRWLEGRIAVGQGRKEDAKEALAHVREEFAALNLAYDSALSTLELAALYLEDGRIQEVKDLALEMAPVFRAQGVHREALAALQLFRDAAEQETATLDLARRLVHYLERARYNPGLRFAA